MEWPNSSCNLISPAYAQCLVPDWSRPSCSSSNPEHAASPWRWLRSSGWSSTMPPPKPQGQRHAAVLEHRPGGHRNREVTTGAMHQTIRLPDFGQFFVSPQRGQRKPSGQRRRYRCSRQAAAVEQRASNFSRSPGSSSTDPNATCCGHGSKAKAPLRLSHPFLPHVDTLVAVKSNPASLRSDDCPSHRNTQILKCMPSTS